MKIVDYPVTENLRDLRKKDIGKIIKIKGVVTKRSAVFSQLKKVYYVCERCGDLKGPIYLNTFEKSSIGACHMCQSKGPFSIN